MRPMLAEKTDGKGLRYPLLASPKLDGVRCLIVDGVALTRSMKPVPNRFVQKMFGHRRYDGLDGELVVGDPAVPGAFNRTSSGVMSPEGEPHANLYAFDSFLEPGGFSRRLDAVSRLQKRYGGFSVIDHEEVETQTELADAEAMFLEQGYEGVMLRDPDGPYKHGRSTLKEGWLLKLKRFVDSEAVVVDATELMTNQNEAKRNALGYLERSSHKAGKKGAGMLGSLVVRDLRTKVVFEIGTGFTQGDRLAIWRDDKLIGRTVKYKSQPTGVKDKPRFPVFLGFRDGRDM